MDEPQLQKSKEVKWHLKECVLVEGGKARRYR